MADTSSGAQRRQGNLGRERMYLVTWVAQGTEVGRRMTIDREAVGSLVCKSKSKLKRHRKE